MKRLIVWLLLTVVFAGCVFSSELKESVNYMRVSQLAVLEIDENPTTGYLWHILSEPAGVLRNFLEKHTPGSSLMGAPSVKGWVISAGAEGKALIELKLYRAWESERAAIDYRALTVEVSREGKGQTELELVVNEMKLGYLATVTLEENASTGYTWQYTLMGELKEVKKEVIPDASGRDGAAAKVVWTFEASGRGNAVIVFKYFRSWEGEDTAIDCKAFNVVVR